MNLNFETILDLYTHQERNVLCQIKVNPKSGKLKNFCRYLTQEQWEAFDKELEKLIDTIDEWKNDKCLKFIIKPSIPVVVKKSNLTFEHFYKCFGGYNSDEAAVQANFVLECRFDFQQDVPFNCSQEYSESSFDSIYSPLSYVPCTPQRKIYIEDDICAVNKRSRNVLDSSADTYSSKSTTGITAIKPLLNTTIITSSPEPINATCRSNHTNKSRNNDLLKKDSKASNSDLHNIVLLKKNENKCSKAHNSNANCKILQSQDNCVVKDAKAKNFSHVDNLRKQRSKSENVSVERFHEKAFRNERHHHRQNIVTKKRSNTLDEIPAALSHGVEKSQPKDKMQSMNKRMYKNLDKRDKISLHKSRNEKHEKYCVIKEINSQRKKEKSLSEDDIQISSKAKSKNAPKTSLMRSDNEFEEDNQLDKNLILTESNKYLNSSTESLCGFSPKLTPVYRKANSREVPISLRRSERSPSKPKRFIDEQHNLRRLKKSKKHKSSHCNKELFGTDDHDEDYFENNNGKNISVDNKIKMFVLETPVKENSARFSSSSSSTKHKRKRVKSSSECEQEKRGMSKWLSKKKIISLHKDTTKSSKVPAKTASFKALPLKTSTKLRSRKADVDSKNRSKSPTPTPISLELPSKQELEVMRNKTKLIQTENAKVRAELDKMRTSPPKEVEILSLQNIPLDDILDTFLTHKSELDEIYENNRKKDYIKGHDGINHCFVIRLLQQNIQMKMLEKLTEEYSNSKTTTQATLFANALLPEWVIRVYMNKFNFTRQQAIDQIKAQEEFQLHMEDQADSYFMFD